MEAVINLLRTLQQVRANNEFVLSPAFQKQIGTSYAANAFNVLSSSVYEFELVRMCSLWDAAKTEQQAEDRNSIPAVARLIADKDILEALRAERVIDRSKGENSAQNAKLLAWLEARQEQRAKEEGAKVISRAQLVQSKIKEVEASSLLVNLRNFRDKHIAHSLVRTALERKQGQVDVPQYGHEKELLDKSIEVASDLYYVVCDASYGWEMSWEHSRRYSRALLSRCEFKIVE